MKNPAAITLAGSLLAACLLLTAGCRSSGRSFDDGFVPRLESPAAAGEVSRGNVRPDEIEEVIPRKEPWSFGGASGQILNTPHFQIHTTIKHETAIDRLPLFYEKALAHYTTALAPLPMPEEPLQTFLFQTRDQWEMKTRQILPGQANTFENLGRGGFTTRGTAVLYFIDYVNRLDRLPRYFPRDTFSIAAHEGWHQFTQTTFKQPLPVWLEEGIATYMEGFYDERGVRIVFRPSFNRERLRELRDAVSDDNLISLSELLRDSPQAFLGRGKNHLLVYYAQVWALTRFLAEGEDGRYADALEQLLLDAADGRITDRLAEKGLISRRRSGRMVSRMNEVIVREYFTEDLAQFEASYRLFVEELTRSRRD